MRWSRKSFSQSCIATYQLLTLTERSEAIKSVGYSVLLALFEVLSISLIFPFLYSQIGGQMPAKGTGKLLSFLQSIEWPILLAVLVAVFLIKNLIAIFINRRQLLFLNELYLQYSKRTFNQFYNADWKDHLKSNSADAFQQIKITAWDFTHYVLNGFLTLLSDVIVTICMGAILIWFDYRTMFILIILAVPLIAFYNLYRKKVIQKIDVSFRELTPKANAALSQGIASYVEARIYDKKDFFIEKFISTIGVSNKLLASLKSFSNLPARIFEVLGIVSFVSVILYAKANPVQTDELVIIFGLLALCLYKMIPSFNKILLSLSQIQSYSYSIRQLQANLAHEKTFNVNDQTVVTFRNKISINNLSFQYSTNREKVLQSVSLEIRKGDFVLLEGPSGSGKTTLLNLLSGLITGYDGKISVDGIQLSPEALSSWHKQIAIVAQSPVVLQDTIMQNVAFGEHTVDVDKVKYVIDVVGLSEMVKHLPSGLKTEIGENGLTLSGGQRQRLVLARALYQDPQVLLLDEVTNQLDFDNKIKVLNLLKRLSDSGATVILASHDSAARAFASAMFHFENGNVAHSTNRTEVL